MRHLNNIKTNLDTWQWSSIDLEDPRQLVHDFQCKFKLILKEIVHFRVLQLPKSWKRKGEIRTALRSTQCGTASRHYMWVFRQITCIFSSIIELFVTAPPCRFLDICGGGNGLGGGGNARCIGQSYRRGSSEVPHTAAVRYIATYRRNWSPLPYTLYFLLMERTPKYGGTTKTLCNTMRFRFL